MLTEFGKILRKLRIDKGEILKDMAEKLHITSAYLSAIECGKREIPDWFLQGLKDAYSLTREELQELEKAKDKSIKSYVIELEDANDSQRELALKFARTFKSMDKDNVEWLQNFFNNLSDKGDC